MPELGIFQIEAKIGPATVATMKLQLEDLLAKKDSGETKLDLEKSLVKRNSYHNLNEQAFLAVNCRCSEMLLLDYFIRYN